MEKYMKYFNKINKLSSVVAHVAAGALLLGASAGYAANYHVDVNTSGLIGNINGPFSVDFQFNDGGVLGNNAAGISNFTYSGGSATGSPTLLGGASGNAATTAYFNNSSTFQELYQSFTPGTTFSFNVALTANSDGVTPDSFVFTILDNNLFNIPTTGVGDSLMQVNISPTSVQIGAGLGDFSGVTVNVAAIPEPQTYALFMVGLGLVGFAAARRKQNRS
jgi:hypothetical protein